MRKRIFKATPFIAIIVALVFSLAPILGTTAAPYMAPGTPPIPEFAKNVRVTAGLREINGSRAHELVPVLIEATANEDGSYSLTYEVAVPKALLQNESFEEQSGIPFDLFPFSVFAHNDYIVTRCDQTASVCATLTLNYVVLGTAPNGSQYGYYQNTKNKWTRSDPAVIWSNAYQRARCYAPWYSRSGNCQATVTQSRGSPTSGTTYTLTPWFAGSGNKLYLKPLGAIAGDQGITLKRGTSTWSFFTCVAVGIDRWSECE